MEHLLIFKLMFAVFTLNACAFLLKKTSGWNNYEVKKYEKEIKDFKERIRAKEDVSDSEGTDTRTAGST